MILYYDLAHKMSLMCYVLVYYLLFGCPAGDILS